MKRIVLFLTCFFILSAFLCGGASADGRLLAFPGADGGGKYTQGARAASKIQVYHVTNLNDSGTGSFRDAVKSSGRIIVFDVGGTIKLTKTLSVQGSNLTILGQTAPGDGITLTGADVELSNFASNIIMRYIRVRPTDDQGGEPDGIGGRWNKNVIIDHCSMSWSIDEMMTLYAGSSENYGFDKVGANLTFQNSIAAESLRMSNHFKGAHGYGAIMGGTNSTWHHNLLAHHDSRSPRLDRELQNTEVANNVIYDWGKTNSAYGAEPYSYNDNTQEPSIVNYRNNYYKYGPGTGSSNPALRSRIFEISGPKSGSTHSRFYFGGNFVFGDAQVTADNWRGVNKASDAERLSEPIDMGEYSLDGLQTAEEAYETVLADAGATLPRRDAIDARIVNDVKNQTGRIVNNDEEAGGIIKTSTAQRVFSIPDDWKTENGMGSAKETDIVPSGEWAGYTWIEAYVNDWTESQSAPSNPKITVYAPDIESMETLSRTRPVYDSAEPVEYRAAAEPEKAGDPEIERIEIYDGETLVRTVNGNTVDEELRLSPGTHYLSSRAYNTNEEATQSVVSIVYVTQSGGVAGYEHTQIGNPAYGDKGKSWTQGSRIAIMGSGRLGFSDKGDSIKGVSSDSCDFMYKEINGDFDMTVKLDKTPKVDNGSSVGLMMRESLEPSARMVMLADGWLKYGENVRVMSRLANGASSEVAWFSGIVNDSDYDTSKYPMPNYMRIQRKGDNITVSVSDSGSSWNDNQRQPQTITLSGLSDTVYVGIAADSGQPNRSPVKEYMSESLFSELNIIGTGPTPPPTATPAPKYGINIDSSVSNGTITVTDPASSRVEWSVRGAVPPQMPSGTLVYGDGTEIPLEEGAEDKIYFYDDAYYYIDDNGTAYFSGETNPTVDLDGGNTKGCVYKLTLAADSVVKAKVYARSGGKEIHAVNLNTSETYYDEFSEIAGPIDIEMTAKAGESILMWADGSKLGIVEIAIESGSLRAERGKNVKLKAEPHSGFFTDSVTVTAADGRDIYVGGSGNEFSFIMPDADVTISASFLPEGSATSTPKPKPEFEIKTEVPGGGGKIRITAGGETTDGATGSFTPDTVTENSFMLFGDKTYNIGETGTIYFRGDWYVSEQDVNGEAQKVIKAKDGAYVTDAPAINDARNKGMIKVTPKIGGTVNINVYCDSSSYKNFFVYDMTDQNYVLRDEREGYGSITAFSFECVEDHVYYIAFMNGYFGLRDLTVSAGAKAVADETIDILALPDDGMATKSVSLDLPGVELNKISDNEYSFVMPFADVKVTAEFEKLAEPTPSPAPTDTPKPTETPEPTNTPRPNEEYRIVSAETVSGGTDVTVEGGSESAELIAAKYDADGVMRDFKTLRILGAGTYRLDGFAVSGGESAKIFIWNAADGMRPLSIPREIKN